MVANYIFELDRLKNYGTEIIYISKASILKIEKIKLKDDLNYNKLDHVYLPPTTFIDLSFIKSLDICGKFFGKYSFLFYILVNEFCA